MSNNARKLVKCYDYRGTDHKIVFQVCRFEPKQFLQRRPNPNFDDRRPEDKVTNPQWIWNLEGVEPILYRFMHFTSQLKMRPKRWVFIVEGEKDVDFLESQNLLATTNPGGAGKWKQEYNQHFKGYSVCVIPDNDPVNPQMGFSPGIEHATEIATQLTGIAARVKFLTLPNSRPKGDIVDWWQDRLAAGLKSDEVYAELADLLLKAPIFVLSGIPPQSNDLYRNPPPMPPVQDPDAEVPPSSVPAAAPAKLDDLPVGGSTVAPPAPEKKPEPEPKPEAAAPPAAKPERIESVTKATLELIERLKEYEKELKISSLADFNGLFEFSSGIVRTSLLAEFMHGPVRGGGAMKRKHLLNLAAVIVVGLDKLKCLQDE